MQHTLCHALLGGAGAVRRTKLTWKTTVSLRRFGRGPKLLNGLSGFPTAGAATRITLKRCCAMRFGGFFGAG